MPGDIHADGTEGITVGGVINEEDGSAGYIIKFINQEIEIPGLSNTFMLVAGWRLEIVN